MLSPFPPSGNSSSLGNLGLAVNQHIDGVAGDRHSSWTRAANTPNAVLDVGRQWVDSVGKTRDAWANINKPAKEGGPPPTTGEKAARVIRAAQQTLGGIMGGLGILKTGLEVGFANLTAPLAAICPSLPAATVMSPYLGTPHAHTLHPPSGPPPVPPTPMPSLGMVVLGVSVRVLVNNMPAARVEDIGLAPTCCGIPPAWFKIKTGSSNVFFGGNRAARIGDICKACPVAPEVPSIPAGKVMAAVGKAAGAVSKGMGVAGKVAGVLGIAADAAEAATESDEAIAAGKALAAATGAAQMAMDIAKAAAEKTMWLDKPVLPPTGSIGAIIDPSHATVLIGGFPMIDIPDPATALLNRLSRFKAAAPAANTGCGEEGEPVNVVTGANLEESADIPLDVALGLTWRRYYDSSRIGDKGPLGWGWRHEFQCKLRFDLEGVRYVSAQNISISFSNLDADNDSSFNDGYILHRIDSLKYRLLRIGAPTMEFLVRVETGTGRLTRIFRNQEEVRFAYDDQERLKIISTRDRKSVVLEYDARGLLVGLTESTSTLSRQSLVSYQYDVRENLVAWTDALGNRATLDYGERHQLIRKGDRRGYSYYYSYDNQGRCIRTWGEDGMYDVRLTYVEAGRFTQAIHADGGVWTFFYDENGTITRIVDPYGKARERVVASSGRVVCEVDAAGNQSHILYDAAGGLIGRQDPFGHVTRDLADLRRHNHLALVPPTTPLEWERGALVSPAAIALLSQATAAEPTHPRATYDVLGRKIEEISSESVRRRWTYDGNSNVLRYEDGDGSTSRFEYVSWNLVHREIDPLGNATEYAYTARELITKVTDPGGTTSEYDYDLRDNIVRVSRHGRVREQYLRDATDNLIEKRDGAGRTILSFEIGRGNLKTRRRLASGENHYFEYDDCARITRAATDLHHTLFEYGVGRRPTSDTRDGLGVRYHFEAPNRSRIVILDRFEVVYARDGDGNLTITDPNGGKQRLMAHRDGTLVLDLSNGTTETSRYDSKGQCISKTLTGLRGMGSWMRQYSYSKEGDLLAADDNFYGRSRYEYDSAHRLVREVRRNGRHFDYRYDAAGNLLQKEGLNGVVLGGGNRLAAANGSVFSYNDRDHIASQGDGENNTHFEYDSCDRLVRCLTPTGEWSSTYDPLGRRISKTWQGATTEYYWDDNRLALERASHGGLRVYIYLDTFSLVPFMFVDYPADTATLGAGRLYFIATDQIGTPIRVQDDQARPVWQAEVDPYGVTNVRPGNTVDLWLRFPGHQEDREIGLFYNRFRHYNPTLGRYVQSDPIGLAGGKNLYAYSANPLTNVDIFGLHPPKSQGGEDSDEEGLFKNQQPEKLAEELAEAQALGVKPLRPSDPGFEDMVNSGPIKWIVTPDGDLLAVPKFVGDTEIKHTAASGGQPVKGAGEASIAAGGGQVVGLDIDPNSGHYLNGSTPEQSAASKQAGREAFEKNGITFPPDEE